MTFRDPAGIPDPGSVRKSNFVKGFLKKKLTFGVTFLYFLLIFIDFHPKNQKKCNALRNLDFRGCESVELSAFPGKKIHTACILEKREAYRSTPGAPDVRSKHYLRHLTRCWGRLKHELHNLKPTQLEHAAGCAGCRGNGVTAGSKNLTYRAHAFRMTLVAQGKLPLITVSPLSR